MTDSPQLIGADLARLALANARKAAPNNSTSSQARPKPKRIRPTGDGRDPISLAAAITGLGADIPLQAGIAGGNVIDQWATLCPQYDGLVQPIHYDDSRGRLDLRPSTHAYAAQLRILGGQLAKQINDKMGRTVVRTIRVLPVGNITTTPATGPVQTQQEAPVKTRETASRGYRDTLAVVLEHKPGRPPVDPYVEEAMRRQEAALRAGRQPESEQPEADTAPGPKRGSIEASLAAAIAYKRSQQTGGEPRRLFGAT